jgi:hypothetical protein
MEVQRLGRDLTAPVSGPISGGAGPRWFPSSPRRRLSGIVLAPVLALLALSPGMVRADEACDAVMGAYAKLAEAPAVRQTVRVASGTPIEMIAVGDTMYMNHGGGWKAMPMKPGARKEMAAAATEGGLSGCAEVGSESLDGREVTVYAYTPPPVGGRTPGPQQLSIGADGLPYRMTGTVEGDPIEMRMTYDGVTAPVE